jgi:aspartate/methionine/tyrosine aminotransferase
MTIIRPGIDTLEDSPILAIFREGFRVPGIIPMWAGEPDVPTPQFICDAASRALAEGRTFYSDNRGTPATRQAIAAYHRRIFNVAISDDRIAFTFSGMNAVMQVAQALVTTGDNAVAITPCWPNVMRALQINSATVREVPMGYGSDGWHLDLEAVFAACDANTRVIYIATPGNPTGWMIERGQAEQLLGFCRARNIALLSDEVYHRIVYDRPAAFSFLEIARPEDPLFVINSFSKSWAMTGWRIGWLIYPAGCTAAFEKLIQFNTSGGLEFMQAAGIAAIEHGEDFVAHFVDHCRTGRAIVAERLAAMPRIHAIPSPGAFYAMFEIEGVTDTLQFCKRAVHEARIGMAPGTSFGRGSERLIRLCYAKTPALLSEAMDRLERFTASYTEAPSAAPAAALMS